MMKKHIAMLAVLVCMALTMTACSSPAVDEYYRNAQLYMGAGDYAYAAELFARLGEYEDAADYALYARAMQAMEEEEYVLARANLMAVNPFKSSGRYLMLLDAMEAEKAGELEKALPLYEKLGTFEEAHLAAERLQTAIPEAALKEGRTLMTKGEYEKAREIFLSLEGYGGSKMLADNCTASLNKEAYNAAEKLFQSGDLNGAMAAFTALGDTLGAAKRAEECLAAIHAELDARYASVTLVDAPALMDAYAALEGDALAQERIASLTARFGSNLTLMTMDQPCIQLGVYPQAVSGEELPVLWRVLKADGAKLTLLSEKVLDASSEAKPAAVTFVEQEKPAVTDVQLPSMADVSALTNRTSSGTAYALAQGVDHEQGAASYWLRDGLEKGLHPVISADGALTLSAEGRIPGIRPVMTLDLEKIVFTAGSGSAEDPFRIQ